MLKEETLFGIYDKVQIALDRIHMASEMETARTLLQFCNTRCCKCEANWRQDSNNVYLRLFEKGR